MKLTSRSPSTSVKVILQSPGLWLLVGGLEVLFLIHLSEFLYDGYSVSDDYISELGVGPMPSSAIFAASVILFGLMALVAASMLRKKDRKQRLWLLLALTGIGAIGVGAFNMDYIPMIHRASALIAFLFANLAVLHSRKMVRPPLSHVFVVLGLVGLSALGLFGSETYLGLGVGGMERMILYPAMFWAVSFGAYLCATEDTTRDG